MFYTSLEFHSLRHNADKGKYSVKHFDLSINAFILLLQSQDERGEYFEVK